MSAEKDAPKGPKDCNQGEETDTNPTHTDAAPKSLQMRSLSRSDNLLNGSGNHQLQIQIVSQSKDSFLVQMQGPAAVEFLNGQPYNLTFSAENSREQWVARWVENIQPDVGEYDADGNAAFQANSNVSVLISEPLSHVTDGERVDVSPRDVKPATPDVQAETEKEGKLGACSGPLSNGSSDPLPAMAGEWDGGVSRLALHLKVFHEDGKPRGGCKAKIDPGSSVSVICPRTVKYLGLDTQQCERLEIRGVSATSIWSEKCVWFRFQISGLTKVFKAWFYVIDDGVLSMCDVLLGEHFAVKYEFIKEGPNLVRIRQAQFDRYSRLRTCLTMTDSPQSSE
jgi:hypothetical protein